MNKTMKKETGEIRLVNCDNVRNENLYDRERGWKRDRWEDLEKMADVSWLTKAKQLRRQVVKLGDVYNN